MGNKGLLLLVSMFFVLLILPQPPIFGQESVMLEGTVKEHSTGNPIPRANLLVIRRYYYRYSRWRSEIRWETVFHGEVDSRGSFILELPREERYIIYAYYDDPLTPGFDYVPSMKNIQTPSSGKLSITFELWEGATMFLEGEAFYVEATEPPKSSYSVLDPDSEEVIQFGEYALLYEDSVSSYSYFLRFSPNLIIVPADTPFIVKVESVIRVGERSLTRDFFIDKPNHFLLGRGDAVHVDMGEFSLPLSLSKVREGASEVGSMIDEKEESFYLAVERQRFAQIKSLTLEAENDLNQGAYEESFTKLRRAYIEISNLRNWLNSMHTEALMSVFLLILFLAFTATATSFLLFEEKVRKICGASVFYVVFLWALYLMYPGSRLVEASLFIGASGISLITIFGLTALLPRVLKGRGVRGRVPLRTMVVPIFSIAKRSLRRRRLRFVLTLISVMILVSSFISLTSFTTGFGLTFKHISRHSDASTGVLMRAPKPPVMEPEEEKFFWFSPLDNSSIEWFEARPETRLVAPKYENIPYRERVPLFYVERFQVFGIMGVVPSAEAEVLRLNETIIEGRYLNDEDENGVLISADLKEKLNATVGESLTLRALGKTLKLKIIGIFDDRGFEDLRDLDGQSPLPKKIIITYEMPTDGEPIMIEELVPCLPDEVIVVTWKTASKIPGIYLSRLDIILEGEDLKEYIRMMALNKGFRAWASTEEGVYLSQLSSYFEGKGLPIALPWLIVVLNVVVTMLNSLYERRREIFIYSSIGMNPSHISGIFIAEVVMIGVLGGGIGYLMGLGWYKVMSLLALGLQVRQKTSALWVLAAISVSMAAVLVGGLTALRGSVVITPSLRRRWRVEGGVSASREPLELILPVRVTEVDVEGFVGYVMKALRSYRDDVYVLTSGIRESIEETEEASIRRVEFIYRSADMRFGGVYTRNKVILRREKGSEVYTVKLLTEGNKEGIPKAGSLTRKIIMEWSIERGRLKEEEGSTLAEGLG